MLRFSRKILLYILVPLISCIIGGGLIEVAGRHLAAGIVGVESNFYLKYYFGCLNSIFPDEGLEANNSIVLIDVRDYTSREDIACVLETVYNLGPRVIAMDLHFNENSSIKENVNDSLRNVIRRVQDKLVAPVLYAPSSDRTLYEARLPFYACDTNITGIVYSEPLHHHVYDTYSSVGFDNSSVICDERLRKYIDDAPFSTTVIRKYLGNPYWKTEGVFINYISKYFRQFNDISKLSEDDILGSIVLIGDCYDNKDLYSTPFMINGQKDGFAGVVNLAYVLNSLLTTKSYCKENIGVYKFANMPLTTCSSWIDYAMAFVFTLLYFHCYMVLKRRETRVKSLNRKRLYILCAPLLLVVYEVLLIILAFAMTFFFNKLPDLLLLMASILFVGTCSDLLQTYKYFTYEEL